MKKLFERRNKMRKLLVLVFVAVFVAMMCVPSYGDILVYKTSQKTSDFSGDALNKETQNGYLILNVDLGTPQTVSAAQLLTYGGTGVDKEQQTVNVTVTFTAEGGYILATYVNGTDNAVLAGKYTDGKAAGLTGKNIAKTLSGYMLIDNSGFGTMSATLDAKTTKSSNPTTGPLDISTVASNIRGTLAGKGYVDQPDSTPPTPNPMTWAIEPNATSDTAITMTATTATDSSGPVKYFFTNVTDSNHNSGWILTPSWTDTGLLPLTNYTYTVKARDNAPALNETAVSVDANATTLEGPDVTAPIPNPMTWATVPTTVSSSSITMTATTATDPPSFDSVQYYFTNVTDSNHNSGWQSSSTFVDIGLTPGVDYFYNVKARDVSLNETALSTPDVNATTPNLVLYTLDIAIVGSGTVEKAPDQNTYHSGDVVTLTADANDGWTFSGWTGDVNNVSANPTTITIGDSNEAVTATFTQNAYTLTLDVNGSGTVGKAPDQNTYHLGDVVTLTATPATGWSFVNWTGDVNDVNSATATTTMTGNKTVTANFTTTHNYTLTIDVNGDGTVGKNPNKTTYHPGDVVTLTATPATGWSFKNWTGDANSDANGSISNPKTITINGNTTVTANLTVTEFIVTITTVGNGTVAKSPDQNAYTLGVSNLTLTATADTNWAFSSWSGDIDGNTNPVIISTNGNKNITATFVPTASYTLTVTPNANGTVVKDPNKTTYNFDDIVTLTPTANTGYSFSGWIGTNGTEVNDANKILMNSNKTVEANFIAGTYTLTVDFNAVQGSVTPTTGSHSYNSVVTLTPTANPGWAFSGWAGTNGADVNVANKILINGNKTVTAVFTQLSYTLTVNVAGTGSGTAIKTPNQATYHYGDHVTLTATPTDSNTSVFIAWSGDVTGTSNPKLIAIDDSNMTVTATFDQRLYTLTIDTNTMDSGTGDVDVDVDPTNLHYGDYVQLTADPDISSTFNNWSGDLTGTDNPQIIQMLGDKTVMATFNIKTFTLTYDANAHGSITGTSPQTVNYGADGSAVTASPAAHYHFTAWSDGNTSATRTETNVTGNVTVTAGFAINTFTVTSSVVGGNGTISPLGALTKNYGDTQAYTATPAASYDVNDWKVDGSVVQTGGTAYTLPSITATHTVIVNFVHE